jgi:TonB family protein
MSILKIIVPKPERSYVSGVRRAVDDPRQRGLMVGSLCLLLLALGIVLWHDRDFWFPDTQEAETDQSVETAPVAKSVSPRAVAPATKLETVAKPEHKLSRAAKSSIAKPAQSPAAPQTPAPAIVTNRTVLPPLEVEVVAGDTHRMIRPGNNSLHVDLQPGTAPQPATEAGSAEVTANVTKNASERVHMSADATAMVTSPVTPSYPLLARQMKVQGSVILQALIGKDGTIQNLRLVSGPRILASAAENAVRQWHFKPHFEGTEAVETQAKITVNFTISTN